MVSWRSEWVGGGGRAVKMPRAQPSHNGTALTGHGSAEAASDSDQKGAESHRQRDRHGRHDGRGPQARLQHGGMASQAWPLTGAYVAPDRRGQQVATGSGSGRYRRRRLFFRRRRLGTPAHRRIVRFLGTAAADGSARRASRGGPRRCHLTRRRDERSSLLKQEDDQEEPRSRLHAI